MVLKNIDTLSLDQLRRLAELGIKSLVVEEINNRYRPHGNHAHHNAHREAMALVYSGDVLKIAEGVRQLKDATYRSGPGSRERVLSDDSVLVKILVRKDEGFEYKKTGKDTFEIG